MAQAELERVSERLAEIADDVEHLVGWVDQQRDQLSGPAAEARLNVAVRELSDASRDIQTALTRFGTCSGPRARARLDDLTAP